MSDFDAVVIGAGPAGSTVAAGLARAGWRVALVERSAFPRRKVCGEFLSTTSAAVFDRIGVGASWRRAAGPPVRRIGFFGRETMLDTAMPGDGDDGFGRALGRDRLDPLLLETAIAAGVALFQPARATSIDRRGNRSLVELSGDGPAIRLAAGLVVAAHGSWEPGPLPSQLPKRHSPGDHFGFKAYFRNASLPADLMPLLVFPGGYGGLVTADDGRVSLSLCIRRDTLENLRSGSNPATAGEAVHRHILASCRGVREAVGDARLDGSWLSAGPIRPGIRPRWANGILAVGNTAGEAHPIIAEGISMAVQSGWLAALALGTADPQVPDAIERASERYARDWAGQFATRIRAANAFCALAAGRRSLPVMEGALRLAPGLLGFGARLGGKTRPVIR